ncbi:non-heme dioxygenase in morphine synthesis N-terminal family protein [Aspergillus niger]|uniref:Non-heme dioxygenase in morphine synthesis N-terminal family protein n=1 Tax=Aspergillus niger TaxID=5061 RepID=A0A505IF56_ASPNG|nr:non-heme dioxygenase in morphine synthesis N-terminal family protein [Aspergillus niger]
MSSLSGPSMGFNDPERLKLITGILESIRSYELAADIPQGTLQISTPIWFGMWLADISELQWYSREFDRDVMTTLLRHNGGSFARILTMCTYSIFAYEQMGSPRIIDLPGSGTGEKFAASQPGTGAVTPVRSMESSLANSPTASRIAPITTPAESSPAQPVAKKRKYEAMEPPSSPSISSKIKKEINRKDVQCLDRDRVCIISKATDPLHAAHIIPASVCDTTTPTKKLKFLEFKALLRMFWSQETIQRWLEGKESILIP